MMSRPVTAGRSTGSPPTRLSHRDVPERLACAPERGPRVGLREPAVERADREARWIESRRDLVPGERRRDRRVWTSADRVRRDDRLPVAVAERVREHASAAGGLAVLDRDELRLAAGQ